MLMKNEFESCYKDKNPHPRWKVLYGNAEGISGFALSELNAALGILLPYVIEFNRAGDCSDAETVDHPIIIGTPADNPLIAQLQATGKLNIPEHPEGYAVSVGDWTAGGLRYIAIGARTPKGVLNGVEYFNSEIIGSEAICDLEKDRRTMLQTLPDRAVSETPVIGERGIWTWGYTIRDYRGFLDNMARLKMNTLTVWNDVPPVNFREVIDYAAERGIRVIAGFHWGWGKELDLSDPATLDKLEKYVLDHYEKEYAAFGLSAIYFQTLTEFPAENNEIAARNTRLCCEMVNRVSDKLLAKYPGLKIHFGLHAVSIMDNLELLEAVDPRISLVWEDAGMTPYCIDPVTLKSDTRRGWLNQLPDMPSTIAYSKRIARLRGGREFMMVAKGFINLRWDYFEHHRSYWMGGQLPQSIREKALENQALNSKFNMLWFRNYPEVLQFYREVLAENPRETQVTCLFEDGTLELAIQPSIALLAAILWNPCREPEYYHRFFDNDFYHKTQR